MRAREKEGCVKIAAFDAAWLPSPYCGCVSTAWKELESSYRFYSYINTRCSDSASVMKY